MINLVEWIVVDFWSSPAHCLNLTSAGCVHSRELEECLVFSELVASAERVLRGLSRLSDGTNIESIDERH